MARLPPALRFTLFLVRLASRLAPGGQRKDMAAQWEADLFHRWRRFEGSPSLQAVPPGRPRKDRVQELLLWSLGAFRHAWYLLRTEYTMDSIWQDVRYGFRSLIRSRGIIGIAILSLAIGIGANSAIFSVVDVFMIRPLPYPDSDRLYMVWINNPDRGFGRAAFPAPDFMDLKAQSGTMDVAATLTGVFNLSGEFEAERLRGVYATPGFFDILQVQPAMGRGFTPDEGIPGNEQVAVISHELWLRRFEGDAGILGRTIVLDGLPHTVVGVMPPRFWFRFPHQDVFAPLALSGEESRDRFYLGVLGRVREGFTPDQALLEADAIMGRIAAEHPETSARHGAVLQTLHENVFNAGFRSGSLISTVAVAFLLLIACANVANLLLTHAAGRDREVALRGALGASRGRIARQLLTEASIVAGVGGLLGLGVAVLCIRGLVGIMPSDFPRVHEIGLNPRVLAYTATVTLLTGVLFGLAPALQAIRRSLSGALKEGGRGGSGAGGGRLRKGLVVAEMAMALVLLVSSALLVQGFRAVRLGDMGFQASDVLAMRTLLPESQYPDTTAVNAFYVELASRLRSLPGVEGVGGTSSLPAQGNSSTYYVPGDEDYGDASLRRIVNHRWILPGYFGAMDITLLRGRGIEETDRIEAPRVVVISESLARRHWPDSDPVGQRITTGVASREIVGVVADTREATLDGGTPEMVYFSALQNRRTFMEWAIEASVPLSTLVEPVRAQVRAMDSSIPAYDVMSMDALIDQGMGGNLIMAKIMGVVAGIALILALGGVYGVMGYSVSRRTQEMGVRMSLGAARGRVMGMVVRQGVALALWGIGIGIGVALVVTRGLAFFLFGVSPFDPLTFGSVTLVLFAAGVTATIFPARRATRVDPVVALRVE
jgi:putative ABC transport system permease protein